MKLSVAILLAATACGLDTVNPAALTPQPGMPCGEVRVSCGNGVCCPQGFMCGTGQNGCFAGSCCDVGNTLDMARRDAGR